MGIVKKVVFSKKFEYEKEKLSYFNLKFIIETLILMIMPIPYFDMHVTFGTKLPGK